ncbi:exopolysaccharide transport family protein [Tunicatimonas pelagia]|uniref:exopolysaccharide transport family protein n=1 Tax=Tunicatimonas pelagia TaxID=931531 RepID=UPI00266510EB|nr:AAA family ATPase [Tunicatimonas pelagia]WKN42317.1 AAA family ATPase [Tunicatimonas pelagia]
MDVLYLIKLLWQKRWIILSVPLVSVVVALFLTQEAQDRYLSKAQIATGFTVKDRQVKIVDDGFNLREADIMFNNAIETINSPLITSLLSYNLIIHDLEQPTPFRRPVNREGQLITYDKSTIQEARETFESKLDSIQSLTTFNTKERQLIELLRSYRYDYESLKENLRISRVNYTDYIAIEFTSENPQLSAFVVNTLVQEFFRFNTSQQIEQKSQSVKFFENLVLKKKRDLDEKAEELRLYKTTNNVINYQVESEAKVTQIANLEDQKVEAENRVQELLVSLKNVELQIQNPNATYGSNYGGSNNRIVSLRKKLNDLNVRYINTGANNKVLLDSIEQTRDELNVEIAQSQRSPTSRSSLINKKEELEVDLEIAKNQLVIINKRLRSLQSNVSSYASQEAIISRLEQEVEVASTEYLDAQEKLNASKNFALASDNSMKLVLAGQPAVEPEPSKSMITAGLTGMSSLVLCILIILFLQYIDVRIKTPALFRKSSGLSLAGTLNYVNVRQFNINKIFDSSTKSKELSTFEHLIRKLRHEIESANAKVYLITSTKPGEGKSFIILCVAYALSLVGKKVLVIDTNFKHNTLTRTLLLPPPSSRKATSKDKNGAVNSLQLQTHVMNPDSDVRQDYSSGIITASNYRNIDIIGSKPDNNSPSEIFSGRNFQGLLDEVKKHYDYILMEGANLNAYSDTRELVQYTDRVLPIFSGRSIIKQMDRESISFLNSLNGKLMGAILNKVDEKNLHLQ